MLRRLLVVLAVLVVAGFLCIRVINQAGATDSGVPDSFDPYLHRTTGELADPVNLIFRGTIDQAAAAVEKVLGWQAVAGSEMVFYDHGSQNPTALQFGFDLGNGSRYHIRLEAVQQQNGQTYVLSGVHRDDSVACGHVGRAFNLARDTVGTAFAAAGYSVRTIDLQNTSPGRQCDGSFTFGDGSAALIDLSTQGHTEASYQTARRIHLPAGFMFAMPF